MSIVAAVVCIVASYKEGSGFDCGLMFFLFCMFSFGFFVWVFSWCSSFLPQTANIHAELKGDSKLPLDVSER